jgi:hypothetical protein
MQEVIDPPNLLFKPGLFHFTKLLLKHFAGFFIIINQYADESDCTDH